MAAYFSLIEEVHFLHHSLSCIKQTIIIDARIREDFHVRRIYLHRSPMSFPYISQVMKRNFQIRKSRAPSITVGGSYFRRFNYAKLRTRLISISTLKKLHNQNAENIELRKRSL